jgi:hypothetical protein
MTAPSPTAWAQSADAPDPVVSGVEEEGTDAPIATASRETSDARLAVLPALAFTLGSERGALTSLSMPRLPAMSSAVPPEPPAAAAPSPPADNDDGSGLRTAGYVAGGVGLVGMALFAIAGLGAKSAYDKLNADCGERPCTDEAHRSDIEGGRMLQTAANIGLAGGLTGLGVGATLLVLGSRSSVEKRGPSASVSTGGAMITCGGRF